MIGMRRAVLVLLAAGAAGGTGATFSAFSAETSNSGSSLAASAAYCPSTHTELASADAWVDEGSTGTNRGTDLDLRVRSQNAKRDARALVRFALPPRPTGCRLTSATLRINSSTASATRPLEARRLTADWTEGGVTWANQPSDTTTGAATTNSGTGYRTWTVTTLVDTMYTNSLTYGFQIRDAAENSGTAREQLFDARDKGASPPELVVNFGP